MSFPFRRRVHACTHPETFKYFLHPDDVAHTWQRLTDRFGAPRRIEGFGLLEMSDNRLLLRAPGSGNPLTVIRTRDCQDEDVADLHRRLAFSER